MGSGWIHGGAKSLVPAPLGGGRGGGAVSRAVTCLVLFQRRGSDSNDTVPDQICEALLMC